MGFPPLPIVALIVMAMGPVSVQPFGDDHCGWRDAPGFRRCDTGFHPAGGLPVFVEGWEFRGTLVHSFGLPDGAILTWTCHFGPGSSVDCTEPPPPVPSWHWCETFDLRTDVPGGDGEWQCIIVEVVDVDVG